MMPTRRSQSEEQESLTLDVDQPEAEASEHACDVCGKTFPRTQGLGMHRFRAHGIKKDD